ncbi:MAG: hypothetical protein K2Y22_17840 [Candidatus Obscuribacterales bacterium]|nr:hypothetical protein [Candidatus Obscuribacterales bacterium]
MKIAFIALSLCFICPAYANDMAPPSTPPPDDQPNVVLQMQAKQPGDYNFQASVQAPPKSVPFSGGKLGMITPVILNGLKYVDLETGLEIPPPWAKTIPPMPNLSLPPVPEPEPLPPAPNPPNHGRIMAVGRDPYNPGGVIITYQDGTIERVSPPAKK